MSSDTDFDADLAHLQQLAERILAAKPSTTAVQNWLQDTP